jgi:3-phenylpropionate/trans-cinnamate dioxygenase ferredoxin reductase component
MKLDVAARTAALSTKEELGFGKALLATGANVRRLRVDGGDLEGIHYLRALGKAASIRNDAEQAERVVLIGGSYIACEVAASLTTMGKRCTLVMLEDAPLAGHFGAAAGGFFAGVLAEHGIDCVTADPLVRFEGEGRVQRVVTESGRTIEADLVVLGTGAIPDVMLARSSGLELGETGGVRCSQTLETSAEGIWAAGDSCEYDSAVHGRRLRVEHFEVAAAQGRYAAAAMLGETKPYDEIPYFWSDLADWCTLEYVGPAERWDREVVRGSLDDGEFTIFYLDGGKLAAALTVGRSADLEHVKRLIAAGEVLGDRADALADGELGGL